ncbi:MAG: endonuclease [Gemmataceae bacterium]
MFTLLLLTCFFAGGESRLTLKPGWKATSDLKSEHATQAAAADEKRVFAVSSTTVAMYDRDSGKLLAKADGATHLNSAFLFQGKVYCAHSNYPKKPELSEIRVFDPEAKTLTIFHEFKEPPGSIVWNIHDGKHWWCCFAHYGADNPKTVLVRFGDGFKEEQRWSFPKAVVDDWDKMSASGGIWDGDTLLVSHHHYKVLYRLKVPKDGKELELAESLACPFPGQGIATDPKTGGLVGIDRGAKKVVFAAK